MIDLVAENYFLSLQDECWTDSDCGSHGRCINLDATSYPKMQCFCEPGWYGPKCDKESSIKVPGKGDLAEYNTKRLSDKFNLYWKVMEVSVERHGRTVGEFCEVYVEDEVDGSTWKSFGNSESAVPGLKTARGGTERR